MNAKSVEATQGTPPQTEPGLDEQALLASAQAHIFRSRLDAKELTGPILERGLLCSVRRGGSVLRFVPPFTTTTSQFDAAAEILEQAIQGVRT